MKTVREIYDEALALQRHGLAPRAISSRLVGIGNDNGLSVNSTGSARGGPTTFELTFITTGQVILFDGTGWHYRSP
jgi:hypothetical protein